ncbi:hypothetical protein T440DRAFT_473371 [Plenodomus tracheiphilus IPT5]|uniref:Uncharacterized protein n=1 Tax=Plenodomus tracheiphilus IPT5 TaxID=1408161 RepID=A0A6A7AN32_9PLEO|nr:hypothetical protein T440DRAFT_473371 [Plenodomus tracheiphilus IPT5]
MRRFEPLEKMKLYLIRSIAEEFNLGTWAESHELYEGSTNHCGRSLDSLKNVYRDLKNDKSRIRLDPHEPQWEVMRKELQLELQELCSAKQRLSKDPSRRRSLANGCESMASSVAGVTAPSTIWDGPTDMAIDAIDTISDTRDPLWTESSLDVASGFDLSSPAPCVEPVLEGYFNTAFEDMASGLSDAAIMTTYDGHDGTDGVEYAAMAGYDGVSQCNVAMCDFTTAMASVHDTSWLEHNMNVTVGRSDSALSALNIETADALHLSAMRSYDVTTTAFNHTSYAQCMMGTHNQPEAYMFSNTAPNGFNGNAGDAFDATRMWSPWTNTTGALGTPYAYDGNVGVFSNALNDTPAYAPDQPTAPIADGTTMDTFDMAFKDMTAHPTDSTFLSFTTAPDTLDCTAMTAANDPSIHEAMSAFFNTETVLIAESLDILNPHARPLSMWIPPAALHFHPENGGRDSRLERGSAVSQVS